MTEAPASAKVKTLKRMPSMKIDLDNLELGFVSFGGRCVQLFSIKKGHLHPFHNIQDVRKCGAFSGSAFCAGV